MSYEAIYKSAFETLAANAALPPIRYPNVAYGQQQVTHLRVTVIPAQTESIGLNTLERWNAIIQVIVCVPEGTGAVGAAKIADDVIATFPRGLVTDGFRIAQLGWASPPLDTEQSWYKIPVSIPVYRLT